MKKNIADQSVFSEYKNNEDKVTAALLQVLHYGGQKIVCRVFDDIDLPSNEINVSPQATEDESRPDGVVSCDCKYKIYIESKIVDNALKSDHGRKQLEANKKLSLPMYGQYMIYITPDETKPTELESIPGVIWTNWQSVVDKLASYETTDTLVDFLINQFCLFVNHLVFNKIGAISYNGFLPVDFQVDKAQSVIIVGGAWGEEVALNYNFYACQEGRFFQPSKYIAFYHKNRIENLFEIIGDPIESIVIDKDLVGDKYLVEKEPGYDKKPRKFFKLKHVRTFNPVIENDTVDKNGKRCAFTYNQRYTTFDAITNATKTSEL